MYDKICMTKYKINKREKTRKRKIKNKKKEIDFFFTSKM